jgi:hypothetical protein
VTRSDPSKVIPDKAPGAPPLLAEFQPHNWVRREHKESDGDYRVYRCAGCKRFWSFDMSSAFHREKAIQIDADPTGMSTGSISRCGLPDLSEDWKAGGVRGYVTAVDLDNRTFWHKPYDGGEARELPWGTPDETPAESGAAS